MGPVLVADPRAAPALFAVPGSRAAGPVVLMWGCRREGRITPHRSAPETEPEGAGRNAGAGPACVSREGLHATAITGAAAAGNVSLAVETWQRKQPGCSPTCPGEGAALQPDGGLRFPRCQPLSDPNSAGHCWSARCSTGRFVRRNGSNRAEERAGRKRCQMLRTG